MSGVPVLYRLSVDALGSPMVDLSHQRQHVPKTSRCVVARCVKPCASSGGMLRKALSSGAAADDKMEDLPTMIDLPTEWWIPDVETGRSVVVHRLVAGDDHRLSSSDITLSPALPSNARIGCITEIPREGRMLVCDAQGNVFVRRGLVSAAGDEAASKRRRLESLGAALSTSWWCTVVGSRDSVPERGALRPMGAAGWAGLLSHNPFAVVAREHYKDVRVVDVERASVVATLYPTHAPTSLCWTVADSPGYLITVADGPVLTTFDARARGEGVANRLTLRQGTLAWSVSAIGTSAPFALAASDSARCVTVYDVRKWTVVHSISNVLKHDCVGLTPTDASGTHLACTGTDSELRIVPSGKCESSAAAAAPEGEEEPSPTASTFRTRIDTTVHCRSAWFGDWVSVPLAANDSPSSSACVVAGLSTTNEVFIAAKYKGASTGNANA